MNKPRSLTLKSCDHVEILLADLQERLHITSKTRLARAAMAVGLETLVDMSDDDIATGIAQVELRMRRESTK